ncbi:hypothetical protein ACH5RR_039991 [Cinchona calisaya]|uniref:DUF4283 domain-containing protein n=1 Tax=Cinchona calisaya TaxID=153742 RepID=A0ABD2Y5G8_9GENT
MCTVPTEEEEDEPPLVVAYWIVKGKVEKAQLLWEITEYLNLVGAYPYSGKLVHLGGGYFCYEFETHQRDVLNLVTFKVSRIGGGDTGWKRDSDFLRCEFLNTFSWDVHSCGKFLLFSLYVCNVVIY